MAKGYRPVRRDQPFLLPPDMREWLPDDHPVWLVIRAVDDHLDTSAFHALRRTGGPGTAGYDPDMLVSLRGWAYAIAVTSSRRIEQRCATDVAFRVICGGNFPDHVTIARFRAAFPGVVESLFTEVLVLCARLGMSRLGTVALDGMKIAANASVAANRTEEGLRKLAARRAAEHATADAAEDELFGEGRRGDELPSGAADPGSRDERIRKALAELEAEREAARAAREQQAREYLAAGGRARGVPPQQVAVAAAAARLERARAARAAQIAGLEKRAAGPGAAGRRRDRPRAGIEDYCLVKAAREALAAAQARGAAAERQAARQQGQRKGPVRNITDPDSRLMPVRGGGFIQGYNAQNVTSSDGLIIATRLTGDTADTRWYQPMTAAAQHAAAVIAANPPAGPGHAAGGRIGLVLADAGYLSQDNLTSPGPDRLIAAGKRRDARRPGPQRSRGGQPWTSPAITAMIARLATPQGSAAYRQRSHIAETPHGQIKHNMGIRRLAMRGKPKAAAEWTFITTVHNLFKAISSGHLTPQTLTALPS